MYTKIPPLGFEKPELWTLAGWYNRTIPACSEHTLTSPLPPALHINTSCFNLHKKQIGKVFFGAWVGRNSPSDVQKNRCFLGRKKCPKCKDDGFVHLVRSYYKRIWFIQQLLLRLLRFLPDDRHLNIESVVLLVAVCLRFGSLWKSLYQWYCEQLPFFSSSYCVLIAWHLFSSNTWAMSLSCHLCYFDLYQLKSSLIPLMHFKSTFLFYYPPVYYLFMIPKNSYFTNIYEGFFFFCLSLALFLAHFCCSSPTIHNFTAQGQPQRKACIPDLTVKKFICGKLCK